MINWKSLGLFLLTIAVITGILSGVCLFGYGKALSYLTSRHPEIKVTPASSTVYAADEKTMKDFVEYKDNGYSVMIPKDARVEKIKKDMSIYIHDKDDLWEVTVSQKLLRYENSLQSGMFIKNPEGDYYILLKNIFQATYNPILLFQKISYLPSDTTHIKAIKTPSFFGFYIVGKSGNERTEMYRLFDEEYWHNVTVRLDDSKIPHQLIQNIVASVKTDDSPAVNEEEEQAEEY